MFDKKVALVTGASRGIGRAIAVALAKENMHVIVNYNGSKAAAEETERQIQEAGGTCECMQFSVADADATKEAIDTIVKKYERFDVLVNNAGITRDGLVMKMSEADFMDVIQTNLTGAFHTIKSASRQMMKQRSGKIINISSVSGVMGNAGQANYSSAKAGLIGLTKSMAKELCSRNINVNAVAPGFIETDMTDQLSDAVKEAGVKQIPLGRFGRPEDIANTVAFLASEKADYITGQVICVDGGMS